MISSRRPTTSKLSLSWKNPEARAAAWVLGIFAAILCFHGLSLGLSDDEAYYWVLAQRPALGYAYHPPAMAWFIAAFQAALGRWTGANSVAVVRLPAILSATAILALGAAWVHGLPGTKWRLPRILATLAAFAGFFALSWMMVPDIPLFLGWTAAFVLTWRLCFEARSGARDAVLLALAVALTLLSKYSGVLAAGSSGLAILCFAPPSRKARGVLCVLLGAAAAAVPILLWNSSHQWASLLYQLRERHAGAQVSWTRFARFWAIEAALAGPALIWAWARIDWRDRVSRFCAVWILPGLLVFGVQPLFSDFKPHWALAFWWPVLLLATAAAARRKSLRRWCKVHLAYGAALWVFVVASCHLPVMGWIGSHALPRWNPLWDVTNDLYGWDRLPGWLDSEGSADAVVGSRYQTASQAAFALGNSRVVTLLPRGIKARDEWPSADFYDAIGPGWPVLRKEVIFVADERYDEAPGFKGSRCRKLGRLEDSRFGFPAKWIDAWRCVPGD